MGGGIGVASLVGDATSDPPLTAPRGGATLLDSPALGAVPAWIRRGWRFRAPQTLALSPRWSVLFARGLHRLLLLPSASHRLLWEGHQASGSQRTGL